jgi:site-specific DNA-methyltransferase (adenine-specific)
LMRQLVRASLPLGRGVLLDPFMGAGSTIAAATYLGVRSVGVELDSRYFRMAKSAIPKLAKLELGKREGRARADRAL